MARYDFSAQRLFVEADLAEGDDCVQRRAGELSAQCAATLRVAIQSSSSTAARASGRLNSPKAASAPPPSASAAQVRVQEGGPDIDYLFAPLKRARLDYLVQKATEMGVARLRPVLTRRTTPERVNLERMRANAIEAAEQCGILRIPELHAPEKLERVIANWDAGRPLVFCDEASEERCPLSALAHLEPGPLALLIGPEGGFDEAERDLLLAKPFVTRLSLGPRILRADTAAVAALALVNAVLGDWR